jgi:acyl carrier protein
MTNRELIRDIVATDLGFPSDDQEIDDNANFMEDLGADSLDVVQIIIQVENQFNIDIDDNDAIELRCFGDLVAYVNKRVGE